MERRAAAAGLREKSVRQLQEEMEASLARVAIDEDVFNHAADSLLRGSSTDDLHLSNDIASQTRRELDGLFNAPQFERQFADDLHLIAQAASATRQNRPSSVIEHRQPLTLTRTANSFPEVSTRAGDPQCVQVIINDYRETYHGLTQDPEETVAAPPEPTGVKVHLLDTESSRKYQKEEEGSMKTTVNSLDVLREVTTHESALKDNEVDIEVLNEASCEELEACDQKCNLDQLGRKKICNKNFLCSFSAQLRDEEKVPKNCSSSEEEVCNHTNENDPLMRKTHPHKHKKKRRAVSCSYVALLQDIAVKNKYRNARRNSLDTRPRFDPQTTNQCITSSKAGTSTPKTGEQQPGSSRIAEEESELLIKRADPKKRLCSCCSIL